MKGLDLQGKDQVALTKELNALLRAKLSVRMQLAHQQTNNTAQLKKIRRDIARIKTVMNQRVGNE